VIFFGPGVQGRALGISDTFSDIGQTIAHHLGVQPLSNGNNLL
jgi:phosphopentomutase